MLSAGEILYLAGMTKSGPRGRQAGVRYVKCRLLVTGAWLEGLG